MTGLDQLFGDVSSTPLCDPVVIDFQPGSTHLPADARKCANVLIDRMVKDPSVVVTIEHQLGAGDRARIAKLARPSPEDLLELGERLRRRRDDAAARREIAAVEARGAFAMGRTAAATAALEELRGLERERAFLESSLDQVFALRDAWERGDEGDSARLLRQAIVDFATLRLEAARDLLQRSDVPDCATRIQVRSPRSIDPSGGARSRIIITPRQRR
jgi:hypothetical protein